MINPNWQNFQSSISTTLHCSVLAEPKADSAAHCNVFIERTRKKNHVLEKEKRLFFQLRVDFSDGTPTVQAFKDATTVAFNVFISKPQVLRGFSEINQKQDKCRFKI